MQGWGDVQGLGREMSAVRVFMCVCVCVCVCEGGRIQLGVGFAG